MRAVKFTGSTQGGQSIAEQCGKYIKKGTFELSGNDPFIVLEDANLEKAVQTAYKSRMNCNAQTGFAAKRIIVCQGVYDEFRDRLLDIIKRKTVIGDPLDYSTNLGPLADKNHLALLKHNLKVAIERDGARVIQGRLDYEIDDSDLSEGNWFAPVVIEGTDIES